MTDVVMEAADGDVARAAAVLLAAARSAAAEEEMAAVAIREVVRGEKETDGEPMVAVEKVGADMVGPMVEAAMIGVAPVGSMGEEQEAVRVWWVGR
tara:strand:+ start:411 stop:698 length:288 start_codon:yes stop_codon:yes gene_type:complete